jgi:TonB family protein
VFAELQPPDSRGRGSWLGRYRVVVVSVSTHLTALAVIVFHNPRIVQLAPTWLAFGDSGHSYHITYIPVGKEEITLNEAKLVLPRTPRPAPARPQPQTQMPKPAESPRPPEPNAEEGSVNSKAGSPLGTVVDGPITGHEVHIALPVYPEPQVDRADLPRDLAGDIVIEVTIDPQGNVIDTKVVKSIAPDIDEKIEATLRRRRYQPATLDGAPVASHQDVHFHFPS